MIKNTLFENVYEDKHQIAVVSIRQVKESDYFYEIKEPNDVYDCVTDFLKNKDREYFICLSLDKKGHVNNIAIVSIGSLWNAVVSPREVFKTAILSNAASIIIAHNHPTGDTTPSKEDKKITEMLAQAGEIMGIEVLDHVIIGDGNYLSFKAKGLI